MFCITKATLMGHIAMWLYRLAPKHQPRKVELIMDYVNSHIDDVFDTPLANDVEFKTHDFESRDDLYQFIDKMMKNIKAFRELNLTWQEYEAGVDADSPDRGNTVVFTSMHDENSPLSWYTKDFIDLDAFVQDVVYSLLLEDKSDREAVTIPDTDTSMNTVTNGFKFYLIASSCIHGSRDERIAYMQKYVDALNANSINVTQHTDVDGYPEWIVEIHSLEEMIHFQNIVEEDIIIKNNWKGDISTIEIYDEFREG